MFSFIILLYFIQIMILKKKTLACSTLTCMVGLKSLNSGLHQWDCVYDRTTTVMCSSGIQIIGQFMGTCMLNSNQNKFRTDFFSEYFSCVCRWLFLFLYRGVLLLLTCGGVQSPASVGSMLCDSATFCCYRNK